MSTICQICELRTVERQVVYFDELLDVCGMCYENRPPEAYDPGEIPHRHPVDCECYKCTFTGDYRLAFTPASEY